MDGRSPLRICYAHPSWYADQGYIVVIQDVRGRGTSEGVFRLFADDVADGEDTIAWAASLPGSSGAVGMYGFSYQGTNQLLAASSGAPALKALAPAMIGWDIGPIGLMKTTPSASPRGSAGRHKSARRRRVSPATKRRLMLSFAPPAPYLFIRRLRRGLNTSNGLGNIRIIRLGSIIHQAIPIGAKSRRPTERRP